MPRYATIEKKIGETPLVATERLRIERALPESVPLAYAGRLDPMATGKLLILIADECKRQEEYHTLDKEYKFSVLFGVGSDTGDVLGVVTRSATAIPECTKDQLTTLAQSLVGDIRLPYPHFSSRTVHGKPLHVWTLKKRLDEITIPVKQSRIYKLVFDTVYSLPAQTVYEDALAKIESIPTVTDERKALGRDFRRAEVRAAWQKILAECPKGSYQIANFRCVASSGTYMRSLAELIAKEMGTVGLAFAIHRTTIGRYQPISRRIGFWRKRF